MGKWTSYLHCGLVADTLLPPHGMLGIRVHDIHLLQFCPDCLMCEITNILEIIDCLSLILPFVNWEQCHVIKTSEIPANRPCGPTSHCSQQSKVKFLLRNYMNSMKTADSKFLFQVKTLYSSVGSFKNLGNLGVGVGKIAQGVKELTAEAWRPEFNPWKSWKDEKGQNQFYKVVLWPPHAPTYHLFSLLTTHTHIHTQTHKHTHTFIHKHTYTHHTHTNSDKKK